MKLFLNSVGVVLLVAMLSLYIIAIWVGDERYGLTGFILLFPAGAALAVASFVSHKESCPGC